MDNNQVDANYNLKVWSGLLWTLQAVTGLALLITVAISISGIGDTPYNWTPLQLALLIAMPTGIIWMVLRKVRAQRTDLRTQEQVKGRRRIVGNRLAWGVSVFILLALALVTTSGS